MCRQDRTSRHLTRETSPESRFSVERRTLHVNRPYSSVLTDPQGAPQWQSRFRAEEGEQKGLCLQPRQVLRTVPVKREPPFGMRGRPDPANFLAGGLLPVRSGPEGKPKQADPRSRTGRAVRNKGHLGAIGRAGES